MLHGRLPLQTFAELDAQWEVFRVPETTAETGKLRCVLRKLDHNRMFDGRRFKN